MTKGVFLNADQVVSKAEIRRLLLMETLVLVAWFIFYYGAWNVMDHFGLTGNLGLNLAFMVAGFGLVLITILYSRRDAEK